MTTQNGKVKVRGFSERSSCSTEHGNKRKVITEVGSVIIKKTWKCYLKQSTSIKVINAEINTAKGKITIIQVYSPKTG